ncbi:ATP-binding protein [Ruminococcaceae bacterium OttesenSCG-928-A16]|nr:ATP-binding protein [Ruminococcaceae bacterium OttesenSCG-928-A16]
MGHKSGIPLAHTTYSQTAFCFRPWFGAQGGAGTVTNSLSCAFMGAMGGGKSMNSNSLLLWAVLFGARAVIIDPKAERGHWKEAFPQLASEINITRLTKDEVNRGILDPYLIFDKKEEAEEICLEILTFLLGVTIQDGVKYPTLSRALKRVSARPVCGLLMVIDELRAESTEVSLAMAEHLESFASLGLSGLLLSDGVKRNTVDLEKRLNIIQVDDLMLPDKDKKREEYSAKEILSVAVMMVVSTFNLKFIRTFPDDYKIVNIDEAWSVLNVAQGAELTNRLNREGRAMNAGIWYSVQNASDLQDGKLKNSLGMVFIHRMTDTSEIQSALELLGVNKDNKANIEVVQNLNNGECVMRDLYGRVNKVKFDVILPQMFHAFDTRPVSKNEQGG